MWTATFSTWRLHSTLSGGTSNKSGREGCWRKLRAELDLLKGEKNVAKARLAMEGGDGESKMDEITRF